MKLFKSIVLTLCLLPFVVVASDGVIAQVKNQLSNVVWNLSSNSEQWGYKVKTELVNSHSKSLRVQHFDPSRLPDKRWQLLLQDNKQPNEKVLAEYAKIHAEMVKEPQKLGFDEQRIVDRDSLKLQREEASHWVVSFNPNLAAFDNETNARLTGLLWLNKTSGKLDKIFIKNTAKLSPSVSISISDYRMTIDLVQHDQTTLVAKTTSIKKGSMFIFNDFDETLTATYSDYRFVTPRHYKSSPRQ